jgi:hypothetical protein
MSFTFHLATKNNSFFSPTVNVIQITIPDLKSSLSVFSHLSTKYLSIILNQQHLVEFHTF